MACCRVRHLLALFLHEVLHFIVELDFLLLELQCCKLVRSHLGWFQHNPVGQQFKLVLHSRRVRVQHIRYLSLCLRLGKVFVDPACHVSAQLLYGLALFLQRVEPREVGFN